MIFSRPSPTHSTLFGVFVFYALMLVSVQVSVRSAEDWMYAYDPAGSRSIPVGSFFISSNNLVIPSRKQIHCKVRVTKPYRPSYGLAQCIAQDFRIFVEIVTKF